MHKDASVNVTSPLDVLPTAKFPRNDLISPKLCLNSYTALSLVRSPNDVEMFEDKKFEMKCSKFVQDMLMNSYAMKIPEQ